MLGRGTRCWITPSWLPAAAGTKLAPPRQGSAAAPLARLEFLPSNPLFLPLPGRPLGVKQQESLRAAPGMGMFLLHPCGKRQERRRLGWWVCCTMSAPLLKAFLFSLLRLCPLPQNLSFQHVCKIPHLLKGQFERHGHLPFPRLLPWSLSSHLMNEDS